MKRIVLVVLARKKTIFRAGHLWFTTTYLTDNTASAQLCTSVIFITNVSFMFQIPPFIYLRPATPHFFYLRKPESLVILAVFSFTGFISGIEHTYIYDIVIFLSGRGVDTHTDCCQEVWNELQYMII